MRWLVALAAVCFVAWPLVLDPSLALADPLSELPVRLWGYERVPWFGGVVDALGAPHPGVLNDPDPLGSAFSALTRPLLGRVGAYDAWVLFNLVANLLATAALGRAVIGDDRTHAPLFGAVAFTLTPLALVYGVSGAVVDLLVMWPWVLAARACVLAWRRGRLADHGAVGAWAALGFIASPYHLPVFAALAVPAAAWIVATRGRSPLPDGAPGRWTWAGVGAAGGVMVILAGPYAWHMAALMSAPESQMSDASVAASRHAWPFPLLSPEHTHRYTAFLLDYVAVGKDALIERVAASRFYRAFSPGLLLLGAAGAGLVLRRASGLWLACFVFAAVASTGPYLAVNTELALPSPVNPAWWALRILPGGALLLEPFRYALPAALALAIAGTIGVDALARRYGAWVPGVATLAWVVELVVVSPVPFPLPTTRVEVPAIYADLGDLPAGAVLEIPYFDRGSDRFVRAHFTNQLVHGRPIADEVLGFVPAYLVDNQFTAGLLNVEKPSGPLGVSVADPSRIDADRARLGADGFALLVLDEARARRPEALRALLAPLGAPVREADGRAVWVLPR